MPALRSGAGKDGGAGAGATITRMKKASVVDSDGASSPSSPSIFRLYVGGLAPGVTEEALAARFAPFGTVQHVEVPEAKGIETTTEETNAAAVAAGAPGRPRRPPPPPPRPPPSRGFAYVDLLPKDEASLKRAFSTYNGCKWNGRTLRVEIAHPHFSSYYDEEAEAAAEADAVTKRQRLKALSPPPWKNGTLELEARPGAVSGKKTLRVKPPKSGNNAAAAARPGRLCWEGSDEEEENYDGEGRRRRQRLKPLDAAAIEALWAPAARPPPPGFLARARAQEVEARAVEAARRGRGRGRGRPRGICRRRRSPAKKSEGRKRGVPPQLSLLLLLLLLLLPKLKGRKRPR